MKKWIGISLGTLFGISHIGMIGILASRTRFPAIDLPIGQYTSYTVNAGLDGYTINYRSHDPKVMGVRKDIERPGGFLGLGKTKVHTIEEYTIEGARHTQRDTGGLNSAEVACIKAECAGESTGRLVGGGVGTVVVSNTGLASVPIIGWVLAGAVTMMGMDQGAEIGGTMAKDFADCDPVVEES